MKRLVKSNEETKYAAVQIQNDVVIPYDSTTAPVGMIVPVAQGPTSNRREGNQISPTTMRTIFHFDFAAGFSSSVDVTIALYILTHKTFKSMAAVLADPNVSKVWDDGAGLAAVAWDPTFPLVSEMKRVDPTVLTLLKKKQFRLIRNVGTDNSDVTPGNAPNVKQGMAKFVYMHKKLPKFKYDGTAQNLPSNYAPYFYAICYRTDGTPMADRTLCPNMTVRSELYYKDS